MGGLPICSGADALRAFENAGWQRDRQKGSHVSLKKNRRANCAYRANAPATCARIAPAFGPGFRTNATAVSEQSTVSFAQSRVRPARLVDHRKRFVEFAPGRRFRRPVAHPRPPRRFPFQLGSRRLGLACQSCVFGTPAHGYQPSCSPQVHWSRRHTVRNSRARVALLGPCPDICASAKCYLLLVVALGYNLSSSEGECCMSLLRKLKRKTSRDVRAPMHRDPNDGALRPAQELPPLSEQDSARLRALGVRLAPGLRIHKQP
ncbi:MAG: type II toxin-antitoxin system HicA family toxin [Candidatus Binataceae bacterium]